MDLWQWHCRNRKEFFFFCNWLIGGKKKNLCGNCGNAIVENGWKKKIVVAEIWGGIKKKKILRS